MYAVKVANSLRKFLKDIHKRQIIEKWIFKANKISRELRQRVINLDRKSRRKYENFVTNQFLTVEACDGLTVAGFSRKKNLFKSRASVWSGFLNIAREIKIKINFTVLCFTARQRNRILWGGSIEVFVWFESLRFFPIFNHSSVKIFRRF